MMMRSALLVIAIPTLLCSSPIMGGPCGTTGTAAEFIALGSTGCNLTREGARIYDIEFVVPQSPLEAIEIVPPSTMFSLIDSVESTEIMVSDVPLGPTLWLTYDSGRPTLGAWSESDKDGQAVRGFAFNDLMEYPGQIVHRFNLSSGQLPYLFPVSVQSQLCANYDLVIESISAPEPSAFLPLLGIGLLLLARYGAGGSPKFAQKS